MRPERRPDGPETSAAKGPVAATADKRASQASTVVLRGRGERVKNHMGEHPSPPAARAQYCRETILKEVG